MIFFLNSTPQWSKTAENQPRVKITAEATVRKMFILNTFLGGCRPKMIIDTHSIKFVSGCSAPIGCNLNYGDFHEIPALGLF